MAEADTINWNTTILSYAPAISGTNTEIRWGRRFPLSLLVAIPKESRLETAMNYLCHTGSALSKFGSLFWLLPSSALSSTPTGRSAIANGTGESAVVRLIPPDPYRCFSPSSNRDYDDIFSTMVRFRGIWALAMSCTIPSWLRWAGGARGSSTCSITVRRFGKPLVTIKGNFAEKTVTCVYRGFLGTAGQ